MSAPDYARKSNQKNLLRLGRLHMSQSFRFRGGPEYVSIVSELVKGS